MKIKILSFLLAFGVLTTSLAANLTFRTSVVQSFNGLATVEEQDELIHVQINSEAEFTNFLSTVVVPSPKYVPLTPNFFLNDYIIPSQTIDFQKETLLIFMLGLRPNASYKLIIDEVEEHEDHLLVRASEWSSFVSGSYMTRPAAVAIVPKTSKPVKVEVVKKFNCNEPIFCKDK